MNAFLPRAGIALLLALVTLPALAGPPGGPGGPGGPGRGWGGPGPGHGHGLPDFSREVWIGSALYFLAAGSYYMWNAERKEYVVVEAPQTVASVPPTSYDVIAYPARGQTAEQQARDRYECHSWAVSQSGFDPAVATSAPAQSAADYYRRALGACLNGRGYSIN